MILARSWAPRWLQRLSVALAFFYLACVWLDAVGLPMQILPLPLRFFTQVAQLFPHAARYTIEWRAEGYDCLSEAFSEVDLRPHFSIHADDKENRFDRAMFFYFKTRPVLSQLDRFISEREARLGHRLGGVRLLSVRIPIPAPGETEARYRRGPLAELPKEYERKEWYVTDPNERERRCTWAR